MLRKFSKIEQDKERLGNKICELRREGRAKHVLRDHSYGLAPIPVELFFWTEPVDLEGLPLFLEGLPLILYQTHSWINVWELAEKLGIHIIGSPAEFLSHIHGVC